MVNPALAAAAVWYAAGMTGGELPAALSELTEDQLRVVVKAAARAVAVTDITARRQTEGTESWINPRDRRGPAA